MKRKSPKVYQFEVTLDESAPAIWRRFQVTDDITLHRLSSIIITVMGWGGGHLHQFNIGGQLYDYPYSEEEDLDDLPPATDESTVNLVELDPDKMKRFKYEYDFGDGWVHTVKLEKVLEPEKDVFYPRCLDGARHCPPDDCGGIGGYEDMLKVIRDPTDPEYESTLEWLGDEFDPGEFDLVEVNDSLKEVDEIEATFDEP
jgi:hypothetical protein